MIFMMSIAKRKVLITGGSGFIGANLTRCLIGQGREVRILDNFVAGTSSYLEGLPVEVIHGDIRDPDAVRNASRGVQCVIHLAAFGSVVDSLENPAGNFDINVRGTYITLDEARKNGVIRFILASTGGALIGETDGPVHENLVAKPISPYGASKLCGEAYCGAFARSYGIETVALRFANVYGPYSWHKKGIITSFARAILRGDPLTIYGDGSATRDFIHVDDLCSGIVAAIDAPVRLGEVIHLATGVETSVIRIAELLQAAAGRERYPLRMSAARGGEVLHNVGSTKYARKVLGFKPTINIDAGLNSLWAWFVSHSDIGDAERLSDS